MCGRVCEACGFGSDFSIEVLALQDVLHKGSLLLHDLRGKKHTLNRMLDLEFKGQDEAFENARVRLGDYAATLVRMRTLDTLLRLLTVVLFLAVAGIITAHVYLASRHAVAQTSAVALVAASNAVETGVASSSAASALQGLEAFGFTSAGWGLRIPLSLLTIVLGGALMMLSEVGYGPRIRVLEYATALVTSEIYRYATHSGKYSDKETAQYGMSDGGGGGGGGGGGPLSPPGIRGGGRGGGGKSRGMQEDAAALAANAALNASSSADINLVMAAQSLGIRRAAILADAVVGISSSYIGKAIQLSSSKVQPLDAANREVTKAAAGGKGGGKHAKRGGSARTRAIEALPRGSLSGPAYLLERAQPEFHRWQAKARYLRYQQIAYKVLTLALGAAGAYLALTDPNLLPFVWATVAVSVVLASWNSWAPITERYERASDVAHRLDAAIMHWMALPQERRTVQQEIDSLVEEVESAAVAATLQPPFG